VTEEIDIVGHKVRTVWNIRNRVTGKFLSLFSLDIEPKPNIEREYERF
jgi:hypothetical protein